MKTCTTEFGFEKIGSLGIYHLESTLSQIHTISFHISSPNM